MFFKNPLNSLYGVHAEPIIYSTRSRGLHNAGGGATLSGGIALTTFWTTHYASLLKLAVISLPFPKPLPRTRQIHDFALGPTYEQINIISCSDQTGRDWWKIRSEIAAISDPCYRQIRSYNGSRIRRTDFDCSVL